MSNLIDPRVSVIIPVYNGENFLKQALDAAIGQTYENIEILVVNDGSNDGGATERIARSYGEKIKYICKENGGVSSALNTGIREMTGEYFSWLSHDDLYSFTKVADEIDLLRSKDMLGKDCIAYTGGFFINVDGKRILPFKNFFKSDKVYSGTEVIDVMTKKGTLNGCCMLIPKKIFDKVGLFNEDLRYSQDSLMWYRIFLSGCCLVSDNKPNVMNRWHNAQVTKTRRDLYEKDALYNAKTLAPSLAAIDAKHKLFCQYLSRSTRSGCRNVVRFLLDYAKKNNVLSCLQLCKVRLLIAVGGIRYNCVKIAKNLTLTLFRRAKK